MRAFHAWIFPILAVASKFSAQENTCKDHSPYACYECAQVNSWICFTSDEGPFQGCTLIPFEPIPCSGATCWVSHTTTGPNR
jgi:hypothetical protein